MAWAAEGVANDGPDALDGVRFKLNRRGSAGETDSHVCACLKMRTGMQVRQQHDLCGRLAQHMRGSNEGQQ